MALQSSFYNTDGNTRTFPSTKHIPSLYHVVVYLKRISDGVWYVINPTEYILVNNSIVFDFAPSVVAYSKIEVRVADTADELLTSPSDISIVANSIISINAIYSNISSINSIYENINSISNVSSNIYNVNTVSSNVAHINSVSNNISSIITTSSNINKVNIVAQDLSGIGFSDIEDLGSVLDIVVVNPSSGISNIETVASSIASINELSMQIVPNLTELLSIANLKKEIKMHQIALMGV